MTRSPKWFPDELILVMELYMSSDDMWLNRINDRTTEVVALSELLRSLNLHIKPLPDNFRSPGAVRMKLGNFRFLDNKYYGRGLNNISSLDRQIWDRMQQKSLNDVRKMCQDIVTNHLCTKTNAVVNKYIKRYDRDGESCRNSHTHYEVKSTQKKEFDEKEFLDYINSTIKRLSKYQEEILKYVNYKKTGEICGDVLKGLYKIKSQLGKDGQSNNITKEHAGVNQRVIVNGDKVGRYVRDVVEEFISSNFLNEKCLEDLCDEDYSREKFRLNHPFFKELNIDEDISNQLRDENGYKRYWIKKYNINEKQYCMCKEWYERQRKYFDKWVEEYKEKNHFELSKKEFESIWNYLKLKDECDPSINKKLFYEQLSDLVDKDKLLNQFVELGILSSISPEEYVIEDYYAFYNLKENIKLYID